LRALATLIVPMLLVPSAVRADDAGLLRCRGLTDAAVRLACYDALVPVATPATVPRAPAPAATSAPAPETPAERFGLQAPPAEPVQAIDSHIPGEFRGWEPRSRIKLANGQVWEVADGSRGAIAPVVDPKVRVRRGAVGSFYLEIEGLNRSPRVKRVE